MSEYSEQEHRKQDWTKHETSGGEFYGGQIMRGGGHFVGDTHFDLDAALHALNLSQNPQEALPPANDALHEAFASLRAAVKAMPTVQPILELLEQELRKREPASDVIGVELVKVLRTMWPPAGKLLQDLLAIPNVGEQIGPLTRAIIEQPGP